MATKPNPLTALQTEPPRDQWGRYLIAPAKGKGKPVGHTRVTTVAKVLDDGFALEKWKLRTALAGLAARPDLLALARTQLGDNRALDRTLGDALEAGGASSRANLGTALHALTETYDRGLEMVAAPEQIADIDAYATMMCAARVDIYASHIEQLLVIEGESELVAGTCDRIVSVDGGPPMIADLKTGRSLDYAMQSIAIQLALYAHATSTYDYRRAAHGPMPAVSQTHALIIHLPAGEARCELHLVDIVTGWTAAQLALKVRASRKHKMWSKALTLATSEELDARMIRRRELLAKRIEMLRAQGALDVLRSSWPRDMLTLKQSTTHTDAELDRMSAVIAAAEKETEQPF